MPTYEASMQHYYQKAGSNHSFIFNANMLFYLLRITCLITKTSPQPLAVPMSLFSGRDILNKRQHRSNFSLVLQVARCAGR